jgi:sugar phosphate isomerase/epimerase
MGTFKLSVINDEITQDFGRAAEVAAKEFGLNYIEIRSMWGKNILKLDAREIAEARTILEKYKLRVSSIASPVFKVDWPGAPTSKFSPKRDQFGADFTFEQQDELLDRSLELARVFQVDRIRIFDFWRLEDPKPYREAMDQKLIEASTKAGKRGITLLLENEPACNTATGEEAARTLAAVRSPNFKLNWDPGNAASRGEIAYPEGYSKLPKERIGYVHCKDVVRESEGKYEWMKMGAGIIDYVQQYRALKRDGYRGTVSLETHWRGAGTPEESTRQSMTGMKELLRRAGAL